MSYPAVTKTWTNTVNNRIAYTTVTAALQGLIHGVKTLLKLKGWTVKGSCSAGVGAMDGVDRITATTDFTPQGAGTGNSQAWIVLTDGSGVDIMFAYQGATLDTCKISMAPLGDFVAAGTANNQPTAVSEVVLATNASSLVGTTTSGDRVWHAWTSSTHKDFRIAVYRAGAHVGSFGVELADSTVVAPMVWAIPVWGFFYSTTNMQTTLVTSASGNGVQGGSRPIYGGTAVVTVLGAGGETVQAGNVNATSGMDLLNEAQGGSSYIMKPMNLVSNTTNSRGKHGNRIDWWYGRNGGTEGDNHGSNAFVQIGYCIWPWDGASTMQIT